MQTNPQIVLSEIENQMARLGEAAIVDYKKELLENNYPLLAMLAKTVSELEGRMYMAEGAIAEALTQMESQILPDLASRIQMTFALGMQVCQLVADVIPAKEMSDDLRSSIISYERAARMLSDEVSDVTLEAVDDDDDDEDNSDDTEGSETPADENLIDQALGAEGASE